MKDDDKSYNIHLDCECHSPEHIVRYTFWDWGPDEMPELFVEVQAAPNRYWYQRIWFAIKYIFKGDGIRWHDSYIKAKDIDVLQKMLTDYKVAYNTYYNAQLIAEAALQQMIVSGSTNTVDVTTANNAVIQAETPLLNILNQYIK